MGYQSFIIFNSIGRRLITIEASCFQYKLVRQSVARAFQSHVQATDISEGEHDEDGTFSFGKSFSEGLIPH